VAEDKLEGPTTKLVFLGFEIDTVAGEIQLPHSKLSDLKLTISSWISKKSCTKRELESITGRLAHASQVVQPGKTFMGRLFALLSGVRRAHHHIRLNQAIRSDLLWWATFISSWNGISFVHPDMLGQPLNHIWTDASGIIGHSAVCPASGRWFQLLWPDPCHGRWAELKEASITMKELLPIVLAYAIWGSGWHCSSIMAHCDNSAAVTVINSGYS